MSFTANQYNYATPLSSLVDFGTRQSAAKDLAYFTLADNKLDGSYHPVSGDVGLWGSALSDKDGYLPAPFVVSATEDIAFTSFNVAGSKYAYPVDFSIVFFYGSDVVHSVDVQDNALVNYVEYLPAGFVATSYELSITRISSANSVARVLNLYEPVYLKSTDSLSIIAGESCLSGPSLRVVTGDTVRLNSTHFPSALTNVVSARQEEFAIKHICNSELTNVHSLMKLPHRRIYGKVQITYTDPMLDASSNYESSGSAHGSSIEFISDGRSETNPSYFMLYDNDLTGNYVPIGENEHVGWISDKLSGQDGVFDAPAPYVKLNFAERPVLDLTIIFDDSRDALAKDFTVEYEQANGNVVKKEFVDNTLDTVVIHETVTNVVSITITITRINREGYPATILEVPIMSTVLYVGYKDTSDLISIDMLEELTYDDEVEALGGVSANEVTVTLDNSNKAFFFNNPNSLISNSLKRNRKIVPWLGVEVVPGEIEWHTLGTYWSYSWYVPVEGLIARVTGFDTLGLLDTTSFTDHQTLIGKSIGELIEYVLDDAKQQLMFVEYNIDPTLYSIYIPYAWFEPNSHTAALRKISGCYPIHIYCDRSGTICAAPQKLHLDYHYDTWADDTNVISKSYNSLYTTLPNIINVTVYNPVVAMDEALATDSLPFNVEFVPTRTLNFSKPYVSDLSVTVDKDSTVQYTYQVYSWGIEFVFTGTGSVRSITCAGNAVDMSYSAVITRRDSNSVRLNGAVTRDIASDFIQTSELASNLIDRFFELSEYDKYDADVEYRGDIALSINDPIILLNGIAPINKYNIKRHELFWDGSLYGSAHLNT